MLFPAFLHVNSNPLGWTGDDRLFLQIKWGYLEELIALDKQNHYLVMKA